MRAAIIDLGTNTFHLIIAEISPSHQVQIIYKTNVPVKLGEGRINENIIIPEAFERGIKTLQDFRKEIDKHQATTIRAIATSAVRSAENGSEFVNAAKHQADIEIEVITGDVEAEYIYRGVKATGVIKSTSLIMDIGGGSTEFIICNQHALVWKKSYNVGAARLMQAYFNSDPISENDKTEIKTHLNETLEDLKIACSIYKPAQLIGSAGAFETFAGLILADLDVKTVKSVAIPFTSYQSLSKQLIASTHHERDQMPGLVKLRVDMIVIAAILTDYVIETCAIKEIILSTYDLKMGILSGLKFRQGLV
ncbi:Ppx/GppA phosphatase family protein [Pedobacter frigoris]|uniref:Exopolyphosphatase n=1 Tax=Pedobacter frigoris TaxID=2571272 RepID=A0A4U1CSQ4_9SPHI|nr:exopolyphosphatase [Pedobacter frigoris]TKC08768.1 exopolyphosphatase [Pedobacter frigoris]